MRKEDVGQPTHLLHLTAAPAPTGPTVPTGPTGRDLDEALYNGADGPEQRQRENETFALYGLADEPERAYLRMVDNPTQHCAVREDGVLIHQPTAAGFVRVAPLPPLRGELGYRLSARAVITRDSPHDIEDARWSLRLASAPADVQSRHHALPLTRRTTAVAIPRGLSYPLPAD